MVRSVGFEPTCGLPHLPLRQACMPFHHERDDDYGEDSGSRTRITRGLTPWKAIRQAEVICGDTVAPYGAAGRD